MISEARGYLIVAKQGGGKSTIAAGIAIGLVDQGKAGKIVAFAPAVAPTRRLSRFPSRLPDGTKVSVKMVENFDDGVPSTFNPRTIIVYTSRNFSLFMRQLRAHIKQRLTALIKKKPLVVIIDEGVIAQNESSKARKEIVAALSDLRHAEVILILNMQTVPHHSVVHLTRTVLVGGMTDRFTLNHLSMALMLNESEKTAIIRQPRDHLMVFADVPESVDIPSWTRVHETVILNDSERELDFGGKSKRLDGPEDIE